MVAHAPFAAVLEQKLGDFDPEPPAAAAHAWRKPGPGPTVLYFDARLFTAASAGPRPRAERGEQAQVRPFLRPQVAPRALRRLTADERQALEHLVSMGADLTASYTDSELRSAFRMLARRYHPDRHPGSDRRELSRLAQAFSAMCAAYRRLLAAPAPVVMAA